MDLINYQKNTIRTCAVLDTDVADTAHMLYGMVSEIDELLGAYDRVNAGEELTDKLWYLCNYCNFNGIQLSDHFQIKSSCYQQIRLTYGLEYDIHLIRTIARLSDWEKKSLAYKREFTSEKRIELVVEIAKALNDCYAVRSLDVFQCMTNNIDKLRHRYPEKFNEQQALNRDIDGEREILSTGL